MSKFELKTVELSHIVISVVTISVAFSIFNIANFLPTLVAVGTAFVLHELAHKYFAIKYGCQAEYRAWTWGLILALVLAFITQGSFVFAAPGAVMIVGTGLTRAQTGKIAIAGPATNFVLALAFVLLVPVLGDLARQAAYVNAFIGLFNMLPFFPIDGEKIASWNWGIWTAMAAALGILLFIGLPLLM